MREILQQQEQRWLLSRQYLGDIWDEINVFDALSYLTVCWLTGISASGNRVIAQS